jgi:hypothetical protein
VKKLKEKIRKLVMRISRKRVKVKVPVEMEVWIGK